MGGRPSAPVLASRRPTSAQLPRAKGSVEGVDAAFATLHVIAVIDPRGSGAARCARRGAPWALGRK
jgi:hypothetical protein